MMRYWLKRNDEVMNAKVINVSSEILQGNEKCQLFASIFMSLHNILSMNYFDYY